MELAAQRLKKQKNEAGKKAVKRKGEKNINLFYNSCIDFFISIKNLQAGSYAQAGVTECLGVALMIANDNK